MILEGQMGSHNQSTSSGPSWVLVVQWLVCVAFATDWCCWRLSDQDLQYGCHGLTYSWPSWSQLFAIAHQVPALCWFCPTSSLLTPLYLLPGAYGNLWISCLGALELYLSSPTEPLSSTCASAVCRTMLGMGKWTTSSDNMCRMCHQPDFWYFRAPHSTWMLVQYLHYVLCQWLQIRH